MNTNASTNLYKKTYTITYKDTDTEIDYSFINGIQGDPKRL